ncbi:hypothetical protein HK102_004522 [Quaeritorhiza haematococci]|nr:hypothetical protein HK102_004522 [Quaeritorhiza haematococci]
MNFPLHREETGIGRKEDNHIVLTCAKISKYHAYVKRKDNKYYLFDRNSSNGVKVNDVLIEPSQLYELQDGDVIMIGTISLTFYDDAAAQGNGDASEPNGIGSSTSAGIGSSSATSTLGRSSSSSESDNYLKLVTILPSEQKYEETVTIRAEMEAAEDVDFRKVGDVRDISTLREDYEKLRLAYELSKMSLTNDTTQLLAKSLDLMFEILPVDRGVVLLVDQNTGILGTHYVKLREGKANEGREILLSSTILRKVHGILHLDSRDRINSFSSKDLSLVKAVSNQTAMAIENSILIKEVETKARITEQLSRFLAPHVVDRMVNRTEIIRKGGREIVGTIIFADIRGFTNLSEACGPSEVVNLLNDYFERLVRIVFKYDGVVDKYIGDALMAVFGTLEEEQDAEFRSVAAALEFTKAMSEMNEERRRAGKNPISIGVGVNTGELLAGFIGCSQRLEYTCIGDTVNTSSRICSMAEKDQVLISQYTYEPIKDRIIARPVGYRQFKGKQKEVMVYEALGIKK